MTANQTRRTCCYVVYCLVLANTYNDVFNVRRLLCHVHFASHQDDAICIDRSAPVVVDTRAGELMPVSACRCIA